MTDETGLWGPASRPEAVVALTQQGLACWFRAWTQITHGLMAASMARAELARSLWATSPADWERALHAKSPGGPALQGLHTARSAFETAVKGSRRINDELAASFFAATESLLEAGAVQPFARSALNTDADQSAASR